jgi:hypothetical protein
VGAGGSQEAVFDLVASVPAGTYHFVLDSIIIDPVDVTFAVHQRRDGSDTDIVTFVQHFDPLPGADYEAQPLAIDQDGAAIDFQPGDQLVFSYTAGSASPLASYEPNGDQQDGTHDPSLTLPAAP